VGGPQLLEPLALRAQVGDHRRQERVGGVAGQRALKLGDQDLLDGLINNAGIADVEHVYDTNVFGPVRVIQAFIPLLQRSSAPVIVNVSSGLGSETLVRDPQRSESSVNSVAYCSSKSALIMITTQYAKGYPDIRINAVDPGYTATDLNHNSGHQTVHEGTDAIVAMASIGPDGPTGSFTDRHGVVPW
jgi:NAD(P)-dependent dehydrogenase (short-subunit alcohol dehydrogenase family)